MIINIVKAKINLGIMLKKSISAMSKESGMTISSHCLKFSLNV